MHYYSKNFTSLKLYAILQNLKGFFMSSKKLYCYFTASLLSGVLVSTSHADHTAYLGANLLYSNTQFKLDYGHDMFRKNAVGLNLSAGYMFHTNFGIEIGGELYKNQKNKQKLFHDIQSIHPKLFGKNLRNTEAISTTNTLKQRHPYIGLVASTKVLASNTSASILLGFSHSKFKATTQILDTTDNRAAGGLFNRGDQLTFSKTKLVPMIRLKLETMLTDSFGLNTILSWHKTSSLKMSAREDNSYKLLPKNSMNVGIGAAWWFA